MSNVQFLLFFFYLYISVTKFFFSENIYKRKRIKTKERKIKHLVKHPGFARIDLILTF